ncbi:MAG: hypothetical protein AWM53_00793 [Candidatus Dichloromethanomonas elyunquensis]|nr:MAG: hypothetical protein AWM53_00793 [Candidatus Dichloromethanomonas elyunquensis]
MEEQSKIVLIFTSVHVTMKAEKILKTLKWAFLLVPVPPFVNEGCGIGIQIASGDLPEVQAYLQKNEIPPIRVVMI